MKACPNCGFLVQEDDQSCSVCKRVFAAPPDAAGAWTDDAGTSGAHPAGWTPPPPNEGSGVLTAERAPARVADVRVRRRRRPGRIIAWILLPILLLGLGTYGYYRFYGYLPLLPHFGSEIDVPESAWATYRDPANRFSLEMPGRPTRDAMTLDVELSAPLAIQLTQVAEPTFDAAVVRTEFPAGTTPDMEAATTASVEIARSIEGVRDAQVVRKNPVPTTYGEALDVELRGTLDDVPATFLIREIISGNTTYEILTIAPVSQASAALDIQNRMVSTFAVPAAPG